MEDSLFCEAINLCTSLYTIDAAIKKKSNDKNMI
uniref:Uncharacterized protein n=1 Tax=Faxonius propinquus nudivirus TaxID=3139431 RepID=A0AAU8GC50_9VIRU